MVEINRVWLNVDTDTNKITLFGRPRVSIHVDEYIWSLIEEHIVKPHKAGTILVDDRLCADRLLGRMRFTCAHELGHWVLHQKLYSGTGDVAAYEGKTSSDESHGLIERQADALATALLMPIPQIKKCFYRLCPGKSEEQLIAEMAQIFQVSKQAIQIRLESHNLL